jgi:DNA-binding transcriptional ArsR family regulator
LDIDPDLGADLDERDFEAARQRARAGVVDLETGAWDPTAVVERADGGWLGLLVVEGLLIRRVSVGKRMACELLGPGDVARPWDADADHEPVPIAVDWLVPRASRLATLDGAFMLRIAPWPSLTGRIVGRVAHRARALAVTQAVSHLPRAYERLLIAFWLLAERWGKVSPDGVRVELPLTHEMLAMLVGAHRPTVTIALQRLTRAGLLKRERSDRWLLTNVAIESLRHPETLELFDEAVEHEAGDREGEIITD